MAKKLDRKKINFMVDNALLAQFFQIVPSGERSDFVNQALKVALTDYGRKRAASEMDKLCESMNLKFSTDEFFKLKNHGRE